MSGLDPDGRFYLSEIIKKTAKEGTAVFLSSHLLHDTEKLCDNLVILKEGKIFFEGQTSELLSSIETKYKVDFMQNSSLQSKTIEDLKTVQLAIDSLRKNGATIVSIEQKRISLEEFFVKNILKAEK